MVAASGPSLVPLDLALPTIAVNDAYQLVRAEILYACDEKWWDTHEGARDFAGEKWSSYTKPNPKTKRSPHDKTRCAEKYGLRLVEGKHGNGFSTDPEFIHYGGNSGFQAINLGMHFGARRILLVGFDMRGSHFFGKHPKGLRNADPARFIPAFDKAARLLKDVEIINCTPGSALKCFPRMELDAALHYVARAD